MAPEGTAQSASLGAPAPGSALPDIPVVDVGREVAVDLVDHARDQALAILATAVHRHSRLGVAVGDRISGWWLDRSDNPYRAEIAAVEERMGRTGARLLNLSYEWSCTTGLMADPLGPGPRMLRTLDWPLPGLGRSLMVARVKGAAGPYWSITWPGYAGVLTAVAPGRFCAAINQPPLRRVTGYWTLDWFLARIRGLRQRALPPPHLLRKVFDEAADYAEAQRMLTRTPLSLPVFFSLTGVQTSESCTIERTEHKAVVHDGPTAIANHWLGVTESGHPRGGDSEHRLAQMEDLVTTADTDDALDWLAPPILNERTRLAAVANAARGSLTVQGFEVDGPATKILTLAA